MNEDNASLWKSTLRDERMQVESRFCRTIIVSYDFLRSTVVVVKASPSSHDNAEMLSHAEAYNWEEV